MYPDYVYLNGEIMASKNAKISVFDRGFLFGDGVYEVMLRINRQFFCIDKHLKRLEYGLQQIRLDFDIEQLHGAINELLKTSNLEKEDSLVYIQVTRGTAPRKHNFPTKIEPTLMIYALPKKFPSINEIGIRLKTFPDFRWHRCDIKSISLLGNVIANDEAIEDQNHEALFERNGMITEGSHSNIFFVKDEVVYTHPANELILNGITRQTVIELCNKLEIPFIEQPIALNEIAKMDESFITGTTTQIAAVKQIDHHLLGEDSIPGRITHQLQKAFSELKWGK